jgi:hypothetical protein
LDEVAPDVDEIVERTVRGLQHLGPDGMESWIAYYRGTRPSAHPRAVRMAIADRLADIVWLERLAETEGER